MGAEVAMIFRDPMTSLNPCYTVGFQIMEAIKVHQGGNKKTRRQRAIDLLNRWVFPIRLLVWMSIRTSFLAA